MYDRKKAARLAACAVQVFLGRRERERRARTGTTTTLRPWGCAGQVGAVSPRRDFHRCGCTTAPLRSSVRRRLLFHQQQAKIVCFCFVPSSSLSCAAAATAAAGDGLWGGRVRPALRRRRRRCREKERARASSVPPPRSTLVAIAAALLEVPSLMMISHFSSLSDSSSAPFLNSSRPSRSRPMT